MIKIVLASDNHGGRKPIEKILETEYQADYYIHLGDSCLEPKDIEPFVSVKGNNDFNFNFPQTRILEIEGHRIYCVHGQYDVTVGYYYGLIEKCQMNNCDMAFFGHTHVFEDKVINGIRIINPGSCWNNRDFTDPSYAVVFIDKNDITVVRKNLPKEKFKLFGR